MSTGLAGYFSVALALERVDKGMARSLLQVAGRFGGGFETGKFYSTPKDKSTVQRTFVNVKLKKTSPRFPNHKIGAYELKDGRLINFCLGALEWVAASI